MQKESTTTYFKSREHLLTFYSCLIEGIVPESWDLVVDGGIGAMKGSAEHGNTERERTWRCAPFKYYFAMKRYSSPVL